MYERFYGLKEKPFSLTPDPEFLFVNNHFRGAFDNIIYGIKRHEGFTAIVGDVGTGKTTLCWSLLGRLDQSIRTALILNPLLTEEDMLKAILQDFGIKSRHNDHRTVAADPEAPYDPSWMQGMTRKELIDELNYFLLEGADQDIFNILIIDEAQNLSLEVLEQLRILSNLETSKKKLLQIIFVGQLEFEEKLRLHQLRQLNQRITIRYALKPLSKQDTIEYIEHRLAVAGSKSSISFTSGALRRIHAFSRGYPRLINVICDRSLLAGYSQRSRLITAKIVRTAARGLRSREAVARRGLVRLKDLLVPVLALLGLALVAAIFFWVLGGSMPVLSLMKRAPLSTLASSNPVSAPAPLPVRGAEPAGPPAIPAVTHDEHDEPVPAPAHTDGGIGLPVLPPDALTPGIPESYVLQVHSLMTGDQADAAIVGLKRKGYTAFSRVLEGKGGNQWHVVYAGPYDTLDQARQGAGALERQQKLRPIIRRSSAKVSQ